MRYVIEFVAGLAIDGGSLPNYLSSDASRRVSETEFPSLEAATEEAARQQARSTMRLTYRARDTQPEGVTMAAPSEVTPNRAIRIYRRGTAWVVDSGGRIRPEMRYLKGYLPGACRETLNQCYSIEDALSLGVNPQMLTSALSAWYVDHPNNSNVIPADIRVAEGISELPDNNAYMAIGDYIYRMVAVRQANTGKAVRIMREKVKREVEALRESLRTQAATEGQEIINQAKIKAEAIRAEAQRELNNVNACLRFPSWLAGYAVQQRDGVQFVMVRTHITFTHIVHYEKQWAVRSDVPRYIAVDLWIPLKGNPEAVGLVSNDRGYLPHIIDGSACMKIGDRIQEINCLDRLRLFQNQISRAMSIINLASLLSPDIDSWMPEIVRMLPDGIKKWLETYRSNSNQNGIAAIAALPPVEHIETGAETWSVR
jgi:hypothetical protein